MQHFKLLLNPLRLSIGFICFSFFINHLPLGLASPKQGAGEADQWLEQFFQEAAKVPSKKARKALAKVLADPKKYRFQLLITEYQKTEGQVILVPHSFRVDHEYLYPASAIKTFGSIAALRHYSILRQKHKWLTTNDPMSQVKKSCKAQDKTNINNQLASLEHEIKKTQLVSSNKAFNTVFSVTGFRTLHEYILPDFPSVRVFHRLSSRETHKECLKTPSLSLCNWTKKGVSKREIYFRKGFVSSDDLSDLTAKLDKDAPTGFGLNRESLKVGKGYKHMKTKKRVKQAMDFTLKNRASFFDFQRLSIGMIIPQKETPFGLPIKLFNGNIEEGGIRKVWLNELRHSMAIYPRHSENPEYSGRSLSETRFKPLISGIRRHSSKKVNEQNLYYLNKAGKALGFHMDNAFIATGYKAGLVNSDSGYPGGKLSKGLFVTIGLYINEDAILNDDKYEYKSISIPLFDAIGYAIGQYLIRK